MKTNLVLIGMRGSGKSTLGKIFAQKHNMKWIDTDRAIEESLDMSIPEIVQKLGWEEFRKIESHICQQISHLENVVISTGGGTLLNQRNREHLKKNGFFVFLYVPIPELIDRIEKSSIVRPPLTKKTLAEEMEDMWEERKNIFFSSADAVAEDISDLDMSREFLERVFFENQEMKNA